MSRVDISIGLLAILATVTITALVGLGEEARMRRASRGWEVRKIELGAQLFDQYCTYCHGENASGGVCPPLDETSGLHGGDLGPGIAWRLEELGWDRALPHEFVYNAIDGGLTISTRPDRYPGNRLPPTPLPPGEPTPLATGEPGMAMPPWGEKYGGPLRSDQIDALASYIVAFSDALPQEPEAAAATARVYREQTMSMFEGSPIATEAITFTSAVTRTAGGTLPEATTEAPAPEEAPERATALAAGDPKRGAELFRTNTCLFLPRPTGRLRGHCGTRPGRPV